MNDILDLFNEFDTNTICVSDFGIITNGIRVDHIRKTKNGKIQIWAGHPDEKYAEELVLNRAERKRILEEIVENF